MKKSLLVLTAALSFGFAAAQTAPATQVPTLTDVPAGHWAKDAIDKIVAKGIILGYPDGTFRGTQNLTRYEAAVIIARLLDQMAQGTVTTTTGTTTTLDPETLTSLQNAVQELAADLAALGVRVSDLEANSVSQEDFARLEAQVNDLGAASGSGDSTAVADLTQQIADVSSRVDDLQSNYDSLRADVDDNASSIAALNDLTVLLNNDILGLQDRVSAVEAAQSDFVSRSDFNTVSTTVTNLDNRVKQLEKYAFSVKPSLSATYYVARATRDFDVDRLLVGTAFSTGDDANSGSNDTSLDYADFTGGLSYLGVPTAANNFGFAGPAGAVNIEGNTTIGFTFDFTTASNGIPQGTSASRGWLVPSAGGLNVNKVDINFGVRAGLPGDTSTNVITNRANYPDAVATDGTVYRPLFFYFKNITTNFTVGVVPVIVDFGKSQKFKFSDLIFDNDATGRGDGYIVTIDGSTLPGFGAFKPLIKAVYGSYKGGALPSVDNRYYRGVRFEITPVGTLKAGINVAQEGGDAFATGAYATDDTVFGADLHGALAGFQIDSELASSRTTPYGGGATTTANALYTRVSGAVGPVQVYDLNFRALNPAYGAVQGIMEAAPLDSGNGSTALYAANQVGYGTKLGVSLGPVALGGYYDRQTAWIPGTPNSATDTARVDRGIAAKVDLFRLVSVRGGFYEYLSGSAAFGTGAGTIPNGANSYGRANYGAAGTSASKYNVRADITPGFGLSLGGYYRHVSLNGTGGVSQSDFQAAIPGAGGVSGSYFRNSRYNAYYGAQGNTLLNADGCNYQHPGLAATDTDGVGGVLTPGLNDGTDPACYTEYGVELAHDAASPSALVRNLGFRIGYSNRYRNFTNSYSNNYFYADASYNGKISAFTINVEGVYSTSRLSNAELTGDATTANTSANGVGLKVVSDTLPVLFQPSVEGQIGFYQRGYDYAGTTADYAATGLKYVAGVKLNQFILPNSKFAVYYAGYRATNRQYSPSVFTVAPAPDGTVTNISAGAFSDVLNNRVTNENGLYFEGNYYDLAFAYGLYSLSQRSLVAGQTTTEYAVNPAGVVNGASARGQLFKITYKVNF